MDQDKRPADGKPAPIFPAAGQVPEELRPLARWIGFRFEFDESKKKWKKPPHSPVTGEGIGGTEKYLDHFLPFDEALAGAKKHGLDGVGFVFVEADGFVGIDYDECMSNGEVHPDVLAWLRWFPSYTEFSPSGSGLHVLCRGSIAKALTAAQLSQNSSAKVEVYGKGRYFTVTGKRLDGCASVNDCQAGIDKLLAHVGQKAPSEAEAGRPMSKLAARKIHADNLESLRLAPDGDGNSTMNRVAFFASRAFAAGALEQTEQHIKDEMLRIVTKEWSSPHPEHGARMTIESGWRSGLGQPLEIAEEDWPQVAQTVEEFNKKFFVVENMGGKCRVCWQEPDDTLKGQTYLTHQSFADFRNRFMHQRIQTGEKTVTGEDGQEEARPKLDSKADVWLRHRLRRQYEKVVFLPGQAAPSGALNLWNGFAFEPKKGDCSLYEQHIFENVCNGNPTTYRWLKCWMAYAVRNPGESGHVAVAVQGQKGVGKNVFAEGFAALWGQHYILVSSERRVTGNFNAHLRDKCVLVADEAFFAGDPRQDRVIKDLVTGKTIAIEAKGVDVVTVPNLLHIIILGNDERLVRATQDERRYFALKCSPKKKGNSGFFSALLRQMKNGGYEALLYNLLHEVDLSIYDPHEAPHTDALRSQMADNLEGIESVWFECLLRGELPGLFKDKEGRFRLRASDLVTWASGQGKRRDWTGISVEKVANLLGDNPKATKKGMGFKKDKITVHLFDQDDRVYAWAIPNLVEARTTWTQKRFRWEWDGETEWQPVPPT